ncbi:SprT-like family-domain-containing protein [Hypoxylon trugodes]|uniref:SprT-like family-domain-containing protein n=1 Tax=Hypoxylon trugodes TaxID=326681 RepID=UPI002190EE6D|nr:SprT-like family-domain-containing protein [Hypoxylon trugodes]KAI1385322.1 SprT-like family-domain-containing protein [Hypoxylon trugodes]
MDSDSDDDFPDVDVIIQRYRRAVEMHDERHDKKKHDDNEEDASAAKSSTSRTEQVVKTEPTKSNAAIKATPLRRRKLGQGQTIDGSLLKPLGNTAIGREKESRASKVKTSQARIREESAEASIPPKASSEPPQPSKARQRGSRTISSSIVPSLLPKEKVKLEQDDTAKDRNVKSGKVFKKPTNPTFSDESDEEELDILDDIPQSNEGDDSEFISVSESESESEPDTFNSDSEPSFTPPIRRSRSPSIQWANPQKLLFKDPVKKTVSNNKQPQQPITNDLTKRASKQHKDKGPTLTSLKPSQPGNLEDAFQKLQIFNEDSELDEPSVKGNKKPLLEPTTPRKTLPASPLKTPRIPVSPWKPEHKEFWDSETHFAWIDKHSPDKKLESPKKGMEQTAKDATTAGGKLLSKRAGPSPEKQKKDARKAFDAVKEEIARNFLKDLDERITEGRLAKMTEDTGGLKIKWSNSLLTTAGRASWKCKAQTTVTTSRNPDGTVNTTVAKKEETQRRHYAQIELATRVLTNESDLLNTVAHEFCHLAVFMLNGGKPKTAHGPEFRAWGKRCSEVYGVSKGINVTTRHNYEIEYKYVWRCEGCAEEVKRHTKSVSTEKHRCGRCRGKLIQIKPTPRNGGGGSTATNGAEPQSTKKKPNAWQEFLGKEMKALTQSNPGMPWKERMGIVSAKWEQVKQQSPQKKDDMKGKTMRDLRTTIEVLTLDEEGESEAEKPTPTTPKREGYDIFS